MFQQHAKQQIRLLVEVLARIEQLTGAIRALRIHGGRR